MRLLSDTVRNFFSEAFMEQSGLLSRRDLLSKGLKTVTALGVGMTAFGDNASIAQRAWANFDRNALYTRSPDHYVFDRPLFNSCRLHILACFQCRVELV